MTTCNIIILIILLVIYINLMFYVCRNVYKLSHNQSRKLTAEEVAEIREILKDIEEDNNENKGTGI